MIEPEKKRGKYHHWTENEKAVALKAYNSEKNANQINQLILPHISSSKISKMLYNLKPQHQAVEFFDQDAFRYYENFLVFKQECRDYFNVYIHVVDGMYCEVGPCYETGLKVKFWKEKVPMMILEVANTTDEINYQDEVGKFIGI
jgi:hypothetical protein